MMNIVSHQGYVNKNHNETPFHILQNGYNKKETISTAGDNREKLESSITVGWTVKWFSHFGKQIGNSLR